MQFARSNPVKRYDAVVSFFIWLHFDGDKCCVSITSRYTSQKFEVATMFWSLADKAGFLYHGVDKEHAKCIVFRMIKFNVPMRLAAEAGKSRLKLGADGAIKHIDSEIAQDNRRKFVYHLKKILIIFTWCCCRLIR